MSDISSITDRLNAATPGPWRLNRAHWESGWYKSGEWNHPEIWGIVAGASEVRQNKGRFHPDHAEYTVDEIDVVNIAYDRDYHTAEGAIPREADAELIANAPSDIAYLLGRVKEAEDALRDAKGTTVVSKAADMASRTPYSFKECFDMLVQATDLWGKLETLEAQREAVLAIHHPMLDEYGEPTKACEECLDAVPCPTVVALGGETE